MKRIGERPIPALGPEMNEIDPENSDIVDEVVQPESLADDPYLANSQIAEPQPELPPQRIPGPGLPESLGWTLSCFVIQFTAATIAVLGYVAYTTLTQGGDIQSILKNMQEDFSVGLIVSGQAAFVLYALFVVTLRVGRPWAGKLNLSPIDPLHFVLILVMLIPLSKISGAFYMAASAVWDRSSRRCHFWRGWTRRMRWR